MDIKKVLVCNKIFSGEINNKYFIGYLHNDHKVKPLHVMLLKQVLMEKVMMNKQTKWTYFLIEDDNLLEKI